MGRLVFSDGGEYYRPGRPHVFDPGLRAAAHYLQAVEKVEPRVRRELDGVLDAHPFPTDFIDWQGLRLEPDELRLVDTPGRDTATGQRDFDRARPFLKALQAWASEYYLWSPHIFGLLYRILELRQDVLNERRYREETVRDWESDPEPMTDDEVQMLDAVKARVQFLTGELDGWGWWVDFLASDITVPQLDSWLAASGLCPLSAPGTIPLNMPSSPAAAALWIFERLERAASETHGIPSLSEHNRQLLQRWDRLHVEIGWEPPPRAPMFRLVLGGWKPDEETWKDAAARLRKGFELELKIYLDRIEGSLKGGTLGPRPKDSKHGTWGEPHAWEAAPTKYGDDHFLWLALRQVKGLRPSEIAERRDVARTVSTVNEGIDSAASLLQLPLRPVRTGPQTVL